MELLLFVSARTAATRPAANRPPAQSVRSQNASGGDVYNASGDAGHVDKLTQEVGYSHHVTHVILSHSAVE